MIFQIIDISININDVDIHLVIWFVTIFIQIKLEIFVQPITTMRLNNSARLQQIKKLSVRLYYMVKDPCKIGIYKVIPSVVFNEQNDVNKSREYCDCKSN
jgi:hypothetical protein